MTAASLYTVRGNEVGWQAPDRLVADRPAFEQQLITGYRLVHALNDAVGATAFGSVIVFNTPEAAGDQHTTIVGFANYPLAALGAN